MAKNFSKQTAIETGWNLTKKHFGLLVGLVVIVFILSMIPQNIVDSIPQEKAFLLLVASIFSILFDHFIHIGYIKILLKVLDKKKAQFGDLFSGWAHFKDYVLGSLLYYLLVGLGLVLFIIPGIIWGLKYQFYGYLIIDKKMGIGQAFQKSAAMTNGHKWNLLFFLIVLVGINLIGVFALLIGLLVSIPVSSLAYTSVYRRLSGATARISSKKTKKTKKRK